MLIDGYVDIDTLNLLCKKKANVAVSIYTHHKTSLTKMDIKKFNAQYPILTLKHTSTFHDRFLIIDQTTAYHIGASLKDAGKKCFALTVLQDSAVIKDLLGRL